jgi:hypothetical protein
MVARAGIVVALLALQGCAGVLTIGCWVENEVPNRSFSLSYSFRTDPNFVPPTGDVWEAVERKLREEEE